jgi:hypothetical protein
MFKKVHNLSVLDVGGVMAFKLRDGFPACGNSKAVLQDISAARGKREGLRDEAVPAKKNRACGLRKETVPCTTVTANFLAT